ncbi:hypothetical protein H6P81_019640 [Aristolochia fimbriata]|uniref:TF-B3 domain-containing protein n=1 Tax=Aristolochia fimbriata TaxID=158543 RepID=A0AAV7DS76_ARIFI|nr:hypothetical protein H6P81_019640 [Aristolochia fimbriata]
MEGETTKLIRRKRCVVDEEADLMEFLEAKRLKQEEEESKLRKMMRRSPDAESLGDCLRTEPRWLGQKKMTKTDVDPHQQRFFIPRAAIQRLKPHLLAWEKAETEPLGAPGISVSVTDPSGCRRELKLKRWSSLNQWALLKGWQPLVDANQLRKEDELGIWAYRHGPHRRLALLLQRMNSSSLAPSLLFHSL